jgi:hypothetical protein
MDPFDLWLKNLDIADPRRDTYREEPGIAAELMMGHVTPVLWISVDTRVSRLCLLQNCAHIHF